MTATKARSQVFDVFLCFDEGDAAVGELVRQRFEEGGLKVFDRTDVTANGADDLVRCELLASAALVAIVTGKSLDSNKVHFLVSAAWATEKPVYLLTDCRSTDLPVFFRRFTAFPIERVDSLARRVEKQSQRISRHLLETLSHVYAKYGISVSALLGDPDSTKGLAKEFNRAARARLSEEIVIRELLRLKKRGQLPKVKTHSGARV